MTFLKMTILNVKSVIVRFSLFQTEDKLCEYALIYMEIIFFSYQLLNIYHMYWYQIWTMHNATNECFLYLNTWCEELYSVYSELYVYIVKSNLLQP